MPSIRVTRKKRATVMGNVPQNVNHSAARRRAKSLSSEAALIAANSFIVRNYPIGFLGGKPRLLYVRNRALWLVPIFLTSPGMGPVGEVGVAAVDGLSGKVTGATPRSEAVGMANELRKAKHHEIEAAFLRARTT